MSDSSAQRSTNSVLLMSMLLKQAYWCIITITVIDMTQISNM
jgi:hypothetical protein